MASYEGYCVKCREKRQFEGQEVELANGQAGRPGHLPTCGTKMNRILGKKYDLGAPRRALGEGAAGSRSQECRRHLDGGALPGDVASLSACRASRSAPSRSPHSLTTKRSTPSSTATVARTAAPTGSSGARRACMPGSASRPRRSSPASWSASSCTWPAGSSTWLTSPGPADGRAPGPRRGQPGQGPHRPPAHHGPGGDPGIARHGPGDGRQRLRRSGPRSATGPPPTGGRRSPAPPAAGPGPPPRSWPGPRRGRRPRPPRGSPAEVHPERRARPRPDPGPLPDEAQPGLLLARRGRSTLVPTTRSRRSTTSAPLAASRSAAVARATTIVGPDLGQPGPQPLGRRHRGRRPGPGGCSRVPRRSSRGSAAPGGAGPGSSVCAGPDLAHEEMERAAPEVPHRGSNPHGETVAALVGGAALPRTSLGQTASGDEQDAAERLAALDVGVRRAGFRQGEASGR